MDDRIKIGTQNSQDSAEEMFPNSEYELLATIGQGGMGKVFKVRNRMLKRIEALKLLKSSDQKINDEYISRFRNEAQVLASLKKYAKNLPIPSVYALRQEQDFFYYTMQYIEGTSLEDYIAAKSITPIQAAIIARDLAWILKVTHEKGIIHRDIKPSNIIIDMHGRSWLLDFGTVKWLEAMSKITQKGGLLGTLHYMSPEQAAGRSDIGPPSDIYSLGSILYEMLTFHPTVRNGPYGEILAQIVFNQPRPPSSIANVHQELERICLKALQKEPQARYQNASELQKELEDFINHQNRDSANNKKFGELCVAKGFVSAKQIKEALEIQKHLKRKGIYLRLGRILRKKKYLTTAQGLSILELQGKKFLQCKTCKLRYNVREYQADKKYLCPECSVPLVDFAYGEYTAVDPVDATAEIEINAKGRVVTPNSLDTLQEMDVTAEIELPLLEEQPRCPKCGFENPEGFVFCGQCATPLNSNAAADIISIHQKNTTSFSQVTRSRLKKNQQQVDESYGDICDAKRKNAKRLNE